MVRVATIAALALALFAVPASAKTFSAQGGSVSATITYDKTATTHLTITRSGATLFDGVPKLDSCGGDPCAPTPFTNDRPLRVLDLDGDGEPEVLYSAYSGGAHCCSLAQVYKLNASASGYDASDHDFWDPGFTLKDLNGDGTPEWLTGDDAFAYRFTSYVFSGLPIVILRYSAGQFTDVTRSFPALIAKDARFWKKHYNRIRRHRDGSQKGPIAAWAADEYRLGKRASARAYIQSEVERGHLKPRFLTSLDRFLRKRGY